jgi:hypothetical protein
MAEHDTRCAVDGASIEVRHAGRILPCRVFFDKAPHVDPGAIVVHKRLGAVLTKIQADQRERDRQRLASPSLTLRQKDRIRAARARAAAPNRAAR